MGVLHVEGLTFTYPQATAPILDGVSFDVREGELVLLCGATGSGKSTLLRLLKRELSPKGDKSGTITVDGVPQDSLSEREAATTIAFVMQHPEHQLVTDTVWHELAFGLENIGTPPAVIVRRVAEIASYFGIGELFERSVAALSGGQKQLLSLASAMAMDPKVLILDEPTAQLDPIAAAEFIATLKKINRELGLTILVCEHRTEALIPVADRLLILESGRLLADAAPQEAVNLLGGHDYVLRFMPLAVRLYHELSPKAGECPMDIPAGRAYLQSHFDNEIRSLPPTVLPSDGKAALRLDHVSFRYDRRSDDVLSQLSLTVYEGETFCLLGGNGAGKSTALAVAAGLLSPYSGRVEVFGKALKRYAHHSLYQRCLAMLPQDVQTVFLKTSVRKELDDVGADVSAFPFGLTPLFDRHPYDLSGGEQQLVALAKVLACQPRLLLLDEPTKGLDAHAKDTLLAVLSKLKADGMTIVAVTHDVEFAAAFADRCALFFRGEAVCVQETTAFFDGNRFYTTAANRMTKGYFDRAITLEDVTALCRRNRCKQGGEPT